MEMRGLLSKFHPIVITIVVGTFLSRFAYFMAMPFLAIFLYSEKGIEPHIVGLIIGSSALAGTFGGFFGGYLSDRIGRLQVMVLAIIVWSLAFFGFAVADNMWVFLFLNTLNGLCRAWFDPISRALLADVTEKKYRLQVFNARYYAINVGAAIGPLVGTYLGSGESMSVFYITGTVFAMYSVVIMILMKKYARKINFEKSSNLTFKAASSVLARDRVLLFFLMGNILIMIAMSQMSSTLAQYMGSSPTFENGVEIFSLLLMTNAITVLVLQYPLTNYLKRFEPLFCLRLGSIAYSLALLGFGISSNIVLLILSMVVMTIGEIIVFIMSDVLLDNLAPNHLRGTYFGAMTFQSIGFSVGPLIGGMLLNYFGFNNGLYVFGILSVITLMAMPFYLVAQYVGSVPQQSNAVKR